MEALKSWETNTLEVFNIGECELGISCNDLEKVAQEISQLVHIDASVVKDKLEDCIVTAYDGEEGWTSAITPDFYEDFIQSLMEKQ